MAEFYSNGFSCHVIASQGRVRIMLADNSKGAIPFETWSKQLNLPFTTDAARAIAAYIIDCADFIEKTCLHESVSENQRTYVTTCNDCGVTVE